MSDKDFEACHAFRCSLAELNNLKQACKEEMQQTYVHGRPLLGQDANEVDEDGTIREAILQAVADSNVFFDSMLSGARWVGEMPCVFDDHFEAAKAHILKDQGAVALTPGSDRRLSIAVHSNLGNDFKFDTPFLNYSSADDHGRFDVYLVSPKDESATPGLGSSCLAATLDEDEFMDDQAEERDHSIRMATTWSALQMSPDINQGWMGEIPIDAPIDCSNHLLPVTPVMPDPESDSDSDITSTSGDASDSVISELRDPFCDSPCSANPINQSLPANQNDNMDVSPERSTIKSPVPRSPSPSPLGMRPTRMERTVNHAMASLESKMTKLEDMVMASCEVSKLHCELLALLIKKIGMMSMARDAEGEDLQDDLDQQKSEDGVVHGS